MNNINIRKACLDDIEDVFHLSNDETVRHNSMTSNEIGWDHHVEWFKNKINDIDCSFYIIENGIHGFTGQIRFDKNIRKAVVSISILKQFRGKGLSSVIIKKATELYLNENDGIDEIQAYVRPANHRSNRSFLKAGYLYSGNEVVETTEYKVYSLTR